MKTCFKCGVEKPLSDFYVHPEMADGHLNKCKRCTCLDVRIRRVTNPAVREYDRQRAKLPHRIALRARVDEEWIRTYPERKKAIVTANNAQRDGRLPRPPAACEWCELSRRLEKHHVDYSKPLSVTWLCKPCHAIADKLRRGASQNGVDCGSLF